MEKCSNPVCEEKAKSKCAACATVSYCGIECQKVHWPGHKKACKAARALTNKPDVTPAVAKPTTSASDDIISKLLVAKTETQQSFNSGDFNASVKSGNEALVLAKLLPEPSSSIEAIQIHLNMTTAYIQLKKAAQAKIHSSLCVEVAERSLALRQGEPQAIEMLVVALGCKSYVLVGDNKIDEADIHASRALSLAEQIFDPKDVRLFKSVRAMGSIREKQNRIDDSASFFARAFDIVFDGHGPLHQETQQVIDELVSVLLKRNDHKTAEVLVRRCYDAAMMVTPDKESLAIGDAAGRLATILAKCGRENDAEPFMIQALTIREKCLGLNHPLVGITLGFMAGIYEGQGKYGEDTEAILLRAMDIFRQAEGPQGPHVRTTLGHVQRIRMKRDGRYTANGTIDEEDEDEGIEEVSSKGVMASKSAEQKERIKEMLDIEFHADDGIGRMRHAAYCFELQEFNKAEVLLAEAYDIFLRDSGPNHASTAAARQNLEVVRTNGLNQLWQEVVREEIERMSENSSPAAPTPNGTAASTTNTKSSNGSSKAKSAVKSKGEAGEIEEVTWCNPQKLSAEDEWLFRDTPKASGCSIC
jgi:hypothetical protein